ncbi:Zinc-type alcohol dehydrogenase-like protein [Colletotrichum sp. SAR 10_66]|nr:Zinc-type alcohol dehydrogenase-like protein [Colletotrichum sp. SAR 10_75]KAI8313324.1 Zinc-type alcohol dehydrogenase-like protein [Colletotrichum sp. SAR11_240]KAJ5007048.1 Zinc-type alcohol dehydrogenase-like protein [Colletotrichum sp. SAR 10_66]
MAPTTTNSWSITGTSKENWDSLEFKKDVPLPQLGDYDVLVQIEAVSLNFRDLAIPKGLYPFPVSFPRVPASDGAGRVLAVGPKVTQLAEGDNICTLFNQHHQSNPITPLAVRSGLGGALDGTLRQYAVFPEHGLVKAPTSLNAIEASTLPCAPLTAWNALYGIQSKALKPGDVVLTQGTGGVSLSAIQFAVAAGATVIATTSSAAKGEQLKKLGAHHVINYKETPNWGEVAKGLTPGGAGADHIIEVGGPGTVAQSLKAVKLEGVISIIGFLSHGDAPKDQPTLLDALANICTIRGLFVGSKQQFDEMNQAIDANKIKPVVDQKIFGFEEVKEAYQYQWDQKHFGKVVVKI